MYYSCKRHKVVISLCHLKHDTAVLIRNAHFVNFSYDTMFTNYSDPEIRAFSTQFKRAELFLTLFLMTLMKYFLATVRQPSSVKADPVIQ